MNQDPNNPFNWRLRTTPSIFATDPLFRARKDGKTVGEVQTEVLDRKRLNGEAVGYMHGIGKATLEKERRLLEYKQFGVYSKAQPGKRENKHE